MGERDRGVRPLLQTEVREEYGQLVRYEKAARSASTHLGFDLGEVQAAVKGCSEALTVATTMLKALARL